MTSASCTGSVRTSDGARRSTAAPCSPASNGAPGAKSITDHHPSIGGAAGVDSHTRGVRNPRAATARCTSVSLAPIPRCGAKRTTTSAGIGAGWPLTPTRHIWAQKPPRSGSGAPATCSCGHSAASTSLISSTSTIVTVFTVTVFAVTV